MATRLSGTLGALIRSTFDAMSDEEARDPVRVANAIGDSVEAYVEAVLQSLILSPVPALQTTAGLGNPTAPGPAPVPIGAFLK